MPAKAGRTRGGQNSTVCLNLSKTRPMVSAKSKKKLFIHPHRASVVRKVFGLATVGNGAGPMGARAIAEWLNLHGHTLANGNKFNNSNVAGILGRCHYRGHYFGMTCDENGGQAPECNWVRVECPSIISDKRWMRSPHCAPYGAPL
jgi:site-specific DNA recombinase